MFHYSQDIGPTWRTTTRASDWILKYFSCVYVNFRLSSIENFYNISMKHYIRCAKVCMEANVNKVVSNKYSKLMGGSNNIYNYIDWLPFWTLCRNSEAFRTFPIKSILISFWCICINLWFKGRYTLRLGFKIQITDALMIDSSNYLNGRWMEEG